MKKLSKISLLVTTIALNTLFTGNVVAKTYPEYKIGDKITYNDMDFYVIEDSDQTKDSVTMLKAEPLTLDEVNIYGSGHVNMYVTTNTNTIYYQKAYNKNGYGGMAYYSSATCGYNGSSWRYDGCRTNYNQSEVKYVVDAWSTDKLQASDLKEDSLGYKTRLITYEELVNNLECTSNDCNVSPYKFWIYNSNYTYWTMSPEENSNFVLNVYYDGAMGYSFLQLANDGGVVRPVITLAKKPIEVYYNIDTKTDDNGTIKIDKKEALEDDKVKISIIANDGYKLNSLKIYKTSDNEDVTDKVGYINETNEFIMPAYDVTVSAEFDKITENKEVIEKENPSENENKIENPKTNDKINVYVIISGLGVGALTIFMLFKRKLNIK